MTNDESGHKDVAVLIESLARRREPFQDPERHALIVQRARSFLALSWGLARAVGHDGQPLFSDTLFDQVVAYRSSALLTQYEQAARALLSTR